jgi:glucose dehydrogenase
MRPLTPLVLVALVLANPPARGLTMNQATRSRLADGTGVSFAEIARPKRGEWPTYHGLLSGNRFSPLDQINRTTVRSLASKWGDRARLRRDLADGHLRSEGTTADARTGKRLWQFDTNQSWRAGPMTYAVDGVQYVAVAAGSNVLAFGLR